ncbi:hypothetical protein [Bergeriella denitrificans]|uniref:Uncharacterized protein n=1 Tax=Bergeriella denitrificans TaxID=494 RepID=A0A378UL39_BERDE|nr:hypothetical protein [Bergeriella denitrificans]STZ77369.1 Uncharacterised protein [Bergeriella denitrificans]
MTEQAPFRSAEDALTFAFHYSFEQSPKNIMSGLLNQGAIGSGHGLHGTDGAAQAAMIHNILNELPDPQRWALTVRFADTPGECPCCGGERQSQAWTQAADNLGLLAAQDKGELDGIGKAARRELIGKILNRRKTDITAIAQSASCTRQTISNKVKRLAQRLSHYERAGLDACRAIFKERGVIG